MKLIIVTRAKYLSKVFVLDHSLVQLA